MRLPEARKLIVVAVLFVLFSAAYWLLPIEGQVLLLREGWQQEQTWPQVQLQADGVRPGEEARVLIRDPRPWAFVKLLVDGREATLQGYERAGDLWQWTYRFVLPDAGGYGLAFYHSCDEGCQRWAQVHVGSPTADGIAPGRLPTKLGVVFPDSGRDWQGRQGWVVQLTYTTLAAEAYWGVDDLARRVQPAVDKGLRVLVRVDYAQGQSLPPAGDDLALDGYLEVVRRLLRDSRLDGVYGYIAGSGYNTAGGNSLAQGSTVTAEWAARVVAGYGVEGARRDNVLAIARAEDVGARVLVGPVTPWNEDQDGALVYEVDAPWLNYMYTLTAALDEAARQQAQAGAPLMRPDGFALQAPGRPELVDGDGAEEPRLSLTVRQWPGAQAGFRVYEQWQDIVNSFETTAGLPLYISATNTYHPAVGAPPAENYVEGWLTTALDVVGDDPQVAALIWFMDDFAHDDQWDYFSLSEGRGQMAAAAAEFERLLGER